MARHTIGLATQRGISLVEAMCVLAVVSVILGSAAPSLGSLRQKAQLTAVAAQLETDVHFARSQATAISHTIALTLREADGGTCYIVHTGSAANCSCSGNGRDAASCSGGGEVLRAASFAGQSAVQVRSASKSLTFDPVKGTVTPTATLRVEGRDGVAIHEVVNLLGRVRSCSPQGRVAGERAC